MLNKNNFDIAARFAGKKGRYVLDAIRVTPDATLATDGSTLVWVSKASLSAKDFPQVSGAPPAQDAFEPFLLDVASAQRIAKSVPQHASIDALNHVGIAEEPGDGKKRPILTVTDLENPQVFRPNPHQGKFPAVDCVFPVEKPVAVFYMNAVFLERVARAVQILRKSNRDLASLRISVYGEERPIRFDAENDAGQGLTALVMPLGGHLSQLKNVYGAEKEAAEDENEGNEPTLVGKEATQ